VLSRRTLLIMDYILVSYLIKVLKRFSVACHYKVYIVDLLLYTLLCSKADVRVYMRTRMGRCAYAWRLWRIIFVRITGFLLAFVNARNKIHVSDSCLLLHCTVAFMKPFISYMADVIVFKAVANLLFL
jgi:hypothetical protein